MSPALFSPPSPQEQAVKTLEKAVTEFAGAPLPAVAKNHQAETALANAWSALLDAGVIRGGQLMGERQAPGAAGHPGAAAAGHRQWRIAR